MTSTSEQNKAAQKAYVKLKKKPKKPTAFPRGAGVLLHPTSLPSRHGIGDVGAGARAFVDWLQAAGCQRWQILPLVPVGGGWSPYASLSSLAGNPMLIDLDDLVGRGALAPIDVEPGSSFHQDKVDWHRVVEWKSAVLQRACDRLASTSAGQELIGKFRAAQPWVDDDALFIALRQKHKLQPWWQWPKALKDREPEALDRARADLTPAIERRIVEQALFNDQWHQLKSYAGHRGVSFIGDIPIYVADDSADVWSNRHLFQLGDNGQPTHVAGCPPDAFSETGQWWGSPLYNWDAMKREHHKWWVARLQRNLELTQIVRIDHFRGFAGYWSIPATAKDARGGTWVDGPGMALFEDIQKALGKDLPVIAEDLGVITDDVVEVRDTVGLPGMKILQFAFGAGSDNAYLPHAHVPNSVVYTGTHDNDTTLGWWRSANDHTKDHVRRYFGRDGNDVVWDFIRACMQSPAHTAIIPFQDILTLDSGARLNTPGLTDGNWAWRVRLDAFHPNLSARLREAVELGGRLKVTEAD